MIIVIIAGGSGTRLWPLSTPDYPKHLLRVNDSPQSLLQATYQRARQLTETIFVITDASHAEHVTRQLPDVPTTSIIIEPARRGTASCIVAGLERISRQAHDPAEPIAFWAADHYIRDTDGFQRSFQLAGEVAAAQARIVLVGVEPDYPATGFGYIEKGTLFDDTRLVYNVTAFKEKPVYDVAQEYVQSGHYLWNCGYFVATMAAFLQAMEQYAPALHDNFNALQTSDDASYEQTYLTFEAAAIDYALIEKVPDLLVVPATFDWMDLGSYGDLHKAAQNDQQGNFMRGNVASEELENSYIINQEEKPVAVIGLDNVVVINSPHGILVARKDLAQKVGEVSKRLT